MPKWRILIVDDEEDIRTIIKGALAAHYEVVEAQDGLDALEKLETAEPDFVILDVMMPLMNGIETCEAIRRHPRYRNMSVLFLSALNSREDIEKGYTAGANLYLTKPFDPPRLLRNVELFFETTPPPMTRKHYSMEQLQNLRKSGAEAIAEAQALVAQQPPQEQPAPASAPLPERPFAPAPPSAPEAPKAEPIHTTVPRVLLVDDDPDLIQMAATALASQFEVVCALNGLEAIEKITSYQPDIIVLDSMMPKMSGYQLCQSLRRNARFSRTPILFISAKSSARDRDYAMRIGGSDFLAKPFELEALKTRVSRMQTLPGFMIYPKSFSLTQLLEQEDMRKTERQRQLDERQDRMHRKEQTELEKFLRDHGDE